MIDKGLTGLVNLGNECYINACTQILAHSDLLNIFLDSSHHLNDDINGNFLKEYNNLRKLMWSKNCVINHRSWINTIQTVAEIKQLDEFIGSDQNDISEFLLFIINTFHEAINRKVDMTIKGTAMNNTDKLAKISYKYLIIMKYNFNSNDSTEKIINELEDNPVRSFYEENPSVKLSLKTLSKRLGIKKKSVYFYIMNTNKVIKINPDEVGSNKYNLNVFKFCDHIQ